MADNNKAQLFLNGKDIEAVDWQISAGINGGWKLTVTYSSGKKYTRPYEEWRIEPSIKKEEDLLYNKSKCTYHKVQSVLEIGYKYFVIIYPSSDKTYLVKKDNVELKKSIKIDEQDIFKYFSRVAQERVEYAKNNKERIIAQSLFHNSTKLFHVMRPY